MTPYPCDYRLAMSERLAEWEVPALLSVATNEEIEMVSNMVRLITKRHNDRREAEVRVSGLVETIRLLREAT